MIILVDYSVLADIPSGIIEMLDLPVERAQLKSWDFFKEQGGLSCRQLRDRIKEQSCFWEDLPVYDWAVPLMSMCISLGTTAVVSSWSEAFVPDMEEVTRWVERNKIPFNQMMFGSLGLISRKEVVLLTPEREVAGRFLFEGQVIHFNVFGQPGDPDLVTSVQDCLVALGARGGWC